MKDSENINNQNNQDSSAAIRAAELAVVGGILTTIGDAISTISVALALEAERQSEIDNNKMQKQIDDLTNEVKQLKKQVNSEKAKRS